MQLFNGLLSITSVSFLIFSIFFILAVGYAVGKITIKGVNLGSAGVFVVALLYGCLLYPNLANHLSIGDVSFSVEALKIVETLGLILFVSSVGFIAGPSFFGDLKKNYKSYVVLGLMIILIGSVACALCVIFGSKFSDLDHESFKAIMVGLLAGALTSTPAFSASKAAVGADLEALVSVGYGIAYIFGVIGVVLFVQIIPKVLKVDMEVERGKIVEVEKTGKALGAEKLINIDSFGLMPFSLAAIIGVFVGSFSVHNFSLTITGGCIFTGLVFGHFGRIGKLNMMPKESTLKLLREIGLVLFLLGAGVSGGARFLEYFQAIYFLYGFIMTVVPMIAGFLFAKYVVKMPLLNNLGSITGGMTSTPALGTLIETAGTEKVAMAYAATYPIALVAVVIASQLVVIFC